MANDRKPRRARSHWEAMKAARAPTSPPGAPEYVDPELTPPPAEIPMPASIEGFDSIPPPIARQLELLSEGLRNTTTALTRVWDARHVGSQLERMGADVSGFTQDVASHTALLQEFVMPAIKSAMAQLTQLSSFHERNSGRAERLWAEVLPELNDAIAKLDDRFDLLDQRLARMEHAIDAIAHHAAQLRDQGERIAALERRNADKELGDKREALVIRRHRRYVVAIVSVISTVGGIVGGWLGFGQ